MGSRIMIADLSKAVLEELDNYRDLAVDELNQAIKDAGETVKKEIAETAPRDTGTYAKSWVSKETAKTLRGSTVTVYSPSRYRIAHLLEHGHAKRGGGRVAARPHIAAAEEKGEKQLEEDLRKALEG